MNQERFEQRIKEKCPIRCLRQIYLISKGSFGTIFSNDLSPKEKSRLLNERKDMLLQHMPVEDIKKYSGATAEEILEVKESLYAK